MVTIGFDGHLVEKLLIWSLIVDGHSSESPYMVTNGV